MDVNFEYYRVFYYVAKYGNFTRAANVLLTSQPAVTYSIRSLEKALGKKLFTRTRRGVTLTTEGDVLYSFVAPACEKLIAGEEMLRASDGKYTGSIDVCATETALSLYASGVVASFRSLFPGVKVDIMGYNTPKALEQLKLGKSDVAVVTSPFFGDVSFESSVVKTFSSSLVSSPSASFAPRRRIDLAEASALPLVITRETSMDHGFYGELFRKRGLVMKPSVTVESVHLALRAAEAGAGVCFVPDELAAPSVAQGRLVRIELEEGLPMRDICVVRDTRRPLSGATKVFADMLDGSFEGGI